MSRRELTLIGGVINFIIIFSLGRNWERIVLLSNTFPAVFYLSVASLLLLVVIVVLACKLKIVKRQNRYINEELDMSREQYYDLYNKKVRRKR